MTPTCIHPVKCNTIRRCGLGTGNMGDSYSKEEEYNSDTDMKDVHHEGIPRLTLSRNSNATNELNRSPHGK